MAAHPPDEPPFVDSTAVLSSLYQAPLADFVTRRTQLVSQLKRSGHKEVAARIASAAKPSRAAYLVNQVFWRARAVYDAVLDAGTAARAAQQARLLGDLSTDLSEVIRERDVAIGAAIDQALTVARSEGPGASDAVATQVRASFESLAAHGLEGRLAHGHLVEDVALPGLGAFAGLILPSTPASSDPVRRFEVVARRSAPETAPALPPPDPRVVETEALVERLREQQADVAGRLDALRRGAAAAEEVAMAAERAAADAARSAAEARQAVQRAMASQEAVAADLARVDAELSAAQVTLRHLQGPDAPPPAAGPRSGRRPRR
jgi:hypothetical protein